MRAAVGAVSRGPTALITPDRRKRVVALLTELGDAKLVSERLGVSVRRVREIAREVSRG